MRILISNDDGIEAEGIWILAREIANRGHHTIIACPMRQQSGMSHALTIGKPIEVKRIDRDPKIEAWAIDGSPTDCVKIFLESMCHWELQREHSTKFNREIPYEKDRQPMPDAVLSGINHGSNLATDVLYSGTVGAALEGFIHELPSMAVSLKNESEMSFESVAKIAADFFESTLQKSSKPFLYNLNFPDKLHEEKIVFTRLGRRDYVNAFRKTHDDLGRTFFEIKGEVYDTDGSEGTDLHAISEGLISVTPLHIDPTDYSHIKEEI